MKLVNFPLHDV